MNNQKQLKNPLEDILKYEEDIYRLKKIEAVLYFILEGQDEYTSNALDLVWNDLTQ